MGEGQEAKVTFRWFDEAKGQCERWRVKIQSLAFKWFFCAAIFCCSGIRGRTEVFLGYTSPSNRLVVASNEVIFISINNAPVVKIARDSTTNLLGLPPAFQQVPFPLAGPFELIVPYANPASIYGTDLPGLISFKRLTNSPIKTVFPRTNVSYSVTVPANKNIRLFTRSRPNNVRITVHRNEVSADCFPDPVAELSGPLDVGFQILGDGIEHDEPVSYYLIEDFLTLPELGFIPGPAGTFEIAVEKSIDLKNWFPVVMQGTSDDQKAFYRLRLSR